MLNQQTLEKLSWIHLPAMAREFRRQVEDRAFDELTFDERFGMIVDAEWTARQNRVLANLLKRANLRQSACLEDIDYSSDRKLNRDLVRQLSTNNWIREAHNLLLIGATGTGKSFLACAFGNNACRQGLKVRYYRVTRLLTDLAIARGDGSYNKLMKELKKIQILILDDWGLASLDPLAGRDLLEVIEDRNQERSTLIASQVPVSAWHSIFQDSTIADAVMDRLVHGAYRVDIAGPSMREKYARKEVTVKVDL
jgi:DNA replication protein DnaC